VSDCSSFIGCSGDPGSLIEISGVMFKSRKRKPCLVKLSIHMEVGHSLVIDQRVISGCILELDVLLGSVGHERFWKSAT
jgi:hypothetical protein